MLKSERSETAPEIFDLDERRRLLFPYVQLVEWKRLFDRRKLAGLPAQLPPSVSELRIKSSPKRDRHSFFRRILDRLWKHYSAPGWKVKHKELPREPPPNVVGLALSGGGIRSATFNLGLLQAFQRWDVLPHVDYLSTVSGGGYIGSCLTWFKTALETPEFPFGTKRKDYDGLGGRVVRWIRSHGSFLTPGRGLNMWALVAAILSGTIINLVILLPVIVLAMLILRFVVHASPYDLWGFITLSDLYSYVRWFGVAMFAVFVVFAAIAAFPRNPLVNFRSFHSQRVWRSTAGQMLKISVFALVIGLLPIVFAWVKSLVIELSLGTGAAGLVSAWSSTVGKKESSKKLRRALASVGLVLIIVAVFLGLYRFVEWMMEDTYYRALAYGCAAAALVLSAILSMALNINHVSMHRFYRNCLMEAFMPPIRATLPEDSVEPGPADQWDASDFCSMSSLNQTAAPYHIINTTVNTVGSKRPRLKGRGGDNFIFSPEFCGSEATTYAPSHDYEAGKANLATAMAISGAAVDPNTYATRSRPLSFLMTMLNIRLGYWIGHPGFPRRTLRFASWHIYMYDELFGSGLSEDQLQIHLSDGGHFENLGLYELLRRKCPYMIVSDCGADPERTFADLAKVTEMARVDFGARIDLDIRRLQPGHRNALLNCAFARGTVCYDDETVGQLLYIKPTLIKGLPEDIYGYQRTHPDFPHESTADQFFDEPQFEAYRELGYRIGECTIARTHGTGAGISRIQDLFERQVEMEEEDAGELVGNGRQT